MSEQFARIAYEAYGKFFGGKNFLEDMPFWNDLPQQTRDAWDVAAQAAIDAHEKEGR